MQFLYSGDRATTGHKERVDIIGTVAQLRGLGAYLLDVKENTAFKGKTGVVQNYPINLAALRVMLEGDPKAKLEITVPVNSLTLTAGKETFRLLGQSIQNSFKGEDTIEYEIVVKGAPDSPVMTNERRDLYLRSVKPQAPKANDEFYGIGL